MDETSIIETYIINSHEKIGGVGEPSTPVITPALVNAFSMLPEKEFVHSLSKILTYRPDCFHRKSDRFMINRMRLIKLTFHLKLSFDS